MREEVRCEEGRQKEGKEHELNMATNFISLTSLVEAASSTFLSLFR